MNDEPQPVRLRPDRKDIWANVRRSFSRAVAALGLSKLSPSKQYPADVLQERWPNDADAKRVLRAITPPMDTSMFYAAMPSQILPALMPNAAAARLFERGRTLNLSGIASLKLPYIGSSGRPPSVPWIGEGQPIAVTDMITSSVVLGPIKKFAHCHLDPRA
jgi:hypothetical protein